MSSGTQKVRKFIGDAYYRGYATYQTPGTFIFSGGITVYQQTSSYGDRFFASPQSGRSFELNDSTLPQLLQLLD